ncbi:MAG: flavodoxin family protein [Sedimentisphaerales bacterium]|nr:flavodoxin family protein [Sedimentisphaerales bacterium]
MRIDRWDVQDVAKRIVAIIGTYRKGRTIDTAVSEVLRGAEARGVQTQRIYLLDKHIEFCTNCRSCTQEGSAGRRGTCVQKDDMDEVLRAIDEADGIVLGAPTNFFNVNALTRRFIERLVPYAYWPWNAKAGPKYRAAKPDKKAVTVTSTACPAFIAWFAMPGARKALKIAARTLGARVLQSLSFGTAGQTPEATLGQKDRRKAYGAGERLADVLNQSA